jgi:hypothetical protein
MFGILCEKYPVHTDAVRFTEESKGFIGDFVAPLDDGEVLRIQLQGCGNIPVTYFFPGGLRMQDQTHTLHDIGKDYHIAPFGVIGE